MRIAFITGHAADSLRKTGFHFWAEILSKRRINVDWVNVGHSHLTRLKDQGVIATGPYNRWSAVASKIEKFVWCPLFHPINLKSDLLNRIAVPFFQFYSKMMPDSLIERLKDANIIIVDTGAGLILVPELVKQCPKAKFVYFSSDRLSTLRAHPAVAKAEREAFPHFSLIRVISESQLTDFSTHPNIQYIPQGIDKTSFDVRLPNPYFKGSKNAINIGDMLFDFRTVEIMAEQFPDWNFHLFGKRATLVKQMPNVTEYGEQPFDTLIGYIQHADIGLAPYHMAEGADYLGQSSLKIAQYTYCRLPIVSPDFIAHQYPHMISYKPENKASIYAAFDTAIKFNRDDIDKSIIPDWENVIDQIITAVH